MCLTFMLQLASQHGSYSGKSWEAKLHLTHIQNGSSIQNGFSLDPLYSFSSLTVVPSWRPYDLCPSLSTFPASWKSCVNHNFQHFILELLCWPLRLYTMPGHCTLGLLWWHSRDPHLHSYSRLTLFPHLQPHNFVNYLTGPLFQHSGH